MGKTAPSWRLADLVDYESFLDADESLAAETLRARDREIFNRVVASADVARSTRVDALRLWLEERRRLARSAGGGSAAPVVLPGEAFAQTSAALRLGLAVVGLVFGGGAAWAALTYTRGGEPINALAFFCEFALLQIVILGVALLGFSLRRFVPGLPSLARLLWSAAAASAGKMWRRATAQVSGATRAEARGAWGALRLRRGLYARVFTWRLLRLTQVFAIAFNLGVLGAMTGRLSLQQLYFGWEATFPAVDAANVHRLVAGAATPWAWSDHGVAPSFLAVERSQNFRLTAERPDPASSPAWGAFLLAAVMFYGLLPRTVLAVVAASGERLALRRLKFNDARSEALWLRLQTPALTVASEPSHAVASRPPVAVRAEAEATGSPPPVAARADAVSRLVFNLTGVPLDAADATLALGPETRVADVLPAGSLEPTEADRSFAQAAARLANDAAMRPVALLGAWMPPMRATHLLLDRIRAVAGPERLIELSLVGKPRPAPAASNGSGNSPMVFRPVEPVHRELWASAVRTRGDAYLSLARL